MSAYEPPEERVTAVCTVCGGDIYPGEVYGRDSRRTVCPDCLDRLWSALLPPSRCRALDLEPWRNGAPL